MRCWWRCQTVQHTALITAERHGSPHIFVLSPGMSSSVLRLFLEGVRREADPQTDEYSSPGPSASPFAASGGHGGLRPARHSNRNGSGNRAVDPRESRSAGRAAVERDGSPVPLLQPAGVQELRRGTVRAPLPHRRSCPVTSMNPGEAPCPLHSSLGSCWAVEEEEAAAAAPAGTERRTTTTWKLTPALAGRLELRRTPLSLSRSASCLLQLSPVVQACCSSSRSSSTSNCLGIRSRPRPQGYDLQRAAAHATPWITFLEVVAGQEFLLLPVEEMERLLT
ncbi:kelch-like protein 5 isoform X2 [Lates japonicus]|uniref:Kelch-like protein 5 isoform X2 n=1 Tax=Lates japonicus TaxID=270547 RepID=A0AAD3N746_LATJO|nr:kelch-like protein 5 isoform X2 [Lates japonicus]